MKAYIKELVIIGLQALTFYLLPPLFFHRGDPIGMVLIMVLVTLVLSLILGRISQKKLRFLYPVAIAIIFLPSVYLYYNHTALIHAVWYLVVSGAGLLLGVLLTKPRKKA